MLVFSYYRHLMYITDETRKNFNMNRFQMYILRKLYERIKYITKTYFFMNLFTYLISFIHNLCADYK